MGRNIKGPAKKTKRIKKQSKRKYNKKKGSRKKTSGIKRVRRLAGGSSNELDDATKNKEKELLEKVEAQAFQLFKEHPLSTPKKNIWKKEKKKR